MHASDVQRAVAAALSMASRLGLTADHAVILRDSNKLTARLVPCDVVARVAHVGHEVAAFEVDLSERLGAVTSPVAAPDPRVEPRVYQTDGFALTLWTYYEPVTPPEAFVGGYAHALSRLHAGMRTLDVSTPHFLDRVDEAELLVVSRDRTPTLDDGDRELLVHHLRRARRGVGVRAAAEQLLHGEPHPGNLISTRDGPVFIDFETCCRGPIEFDLAHVPEAVSTLYPGADQRLLGECRNLVLAMVAAWRCDPGDQLPDGPRQLRALLRALRDGPPWPAIDDIGRGGALVR